MNTDVVTEIHGKPFFDQEKKLGFIIYLQVGIGETNPEKNHSHR